jgi:hypothetical protein
MRIILYDLPLTIKQGKEKKRQKITKNNKMVENKKTEIIMFVGEKKARNRNHKKGIFFSITFFLLLFR